MYTQELGNNERISRGMVPQAGGFLALTYGQSKFFKTEAGATKWLANRNIRPDGSRID